MAVLASVDPFVFAEAALAVAAVFTIISVGVIAIIGRVRPVIVIIAIALV